MTKDIRHCNKQPQPDKYISEWLYLPLSQLVHNLHISLGLSVYYVLQDCYMYHEILGFFLLSTAMPFTILTT